MYNDIEHRDDPVRGNIFTGWEIHWYEGDESIGESYLYLHIARIPHVMTYGELVNTLEGLNHIRQEYPGLRINLEIYRRGDPVDIGLLHMDTAEPEPPSPPTN